MDEPLLVDARAASHLIGIGRTLFLTMDQSGRLGPMSVKFGRRRLWRRAELMAWVEAGCPARTRWLAMREALV